MNVSSYELYIFWQKAGFGSFNRTHMKPVWSFTIYKKGSVVDKEVFFIILN